MSEDIVQCVINHGTDKDGIDKRADAERGLLCRNHAKRLRHWLNEIAVDYVLLDTRLMPSSAGEERHAKGDEAAAPLDLTIASLRDSGRGGVNEPRIRGDELWYELPDIPAVLSTMHARAEDVRCALGPGREPNPSVKDRTVIGEVNYLIAAFDTLCEADWVDEAFDEFKAVWIALQRAHDRPRPKPLGRCLEVDCDGTVWPREETHPWCSTCKRIYDNPTEWARIAVEEDNRRRKRAADEAKTA